MSKATGFPSTEPAYIIKLIVGEGHPVGLVSNGSTHTLYTTPKGSITTIPGFQGPQIEGEIVFGADWIYFDPDQKFTRMNVRGLAKTASNQGISFEYHGVSAITPEIEAIFNHAPQTTPFGASTAAVQFQVGAPELKALEQECWIGNGRFLLEDDVFKVEMRVARVVASTDMD